MSRCEFCGVGGIVFTMTSSKPNDSGWGRHKHECYDDYGFHYVLQLPQQQICKHRHRTEVSSFRLLRQTWY